MSEITSLLKAAGSGDRLAANQAFALLYADLQRLAHSRMRRSGGMTMLDTTALVHESWLRFQGANEAQFADKQHFMGYAARVMHTVASASRPVCDISQRSTGPIFSGKNGPCR